ncbi:protein SOSEKI 2 [Macadamia integrifolia]|uniref:protein SOSEKI 2 n=1 Tax=Macadamia integrifolia TaxID=60698 RepID=UPI001C4F4326|nr:protein SOSEKI 2 [Macadamia integrifolia]
MDVRARKSREGSPGSARVYVQPKLKAFKKVQILYYLSRNGQLEHPHFMEVSHLANQQLRLKDVMDRLTALRGKGMPSLFSWSCKRNYKNGYVWNDLTENDVIYPSEGGGEYVLKGSELIEGCAERFLQLQVSNRQRNPEPNFHSKRKPVSVPHLREREQDLVGYTREDEVDEEEEDDEEKGSNSSSHEPYSRCSRGVSTDEIIEEHKTQPKTHNINNNPTELSLDDASPPSTSSTLSEKAHDNNGNSEKLREDYSTSVAEPIVGGRNKVLLQLIACGSSVATKGLKNTPCLKHQTSTNVRKSSSILHRGVLCKSAASKIMEEEEMEIKFMSENPRFGNPQSEEKEYFSGSIVESMTEDRVLPVEPALKKSSSYNQERSLKTGLGEAIMEVEKEDKVEKGVIGKCIPRKKSSSKPTKK